MKRRLLLLMLATILLASTGQAQEKIKLMYLETEHEVRAAVLIGRLHTPLAVHRVGIFRVGQKLYGVVRFGGAEADGKPADQHRIAATTAILCDRIFGELPDLVQIDFEAVTFVETKERKPDVLYSSSIGRPAWRNIPKALTPLQRVEMASSLYFAPNVAVGKPWVEPVKATQTRDTKVKSESP